MIAVFVNMAAVLVGSFLGILCRNKIKENLSTVLTSALALVTTSIGIASAIKTGDTLCVIICLVIGTCLGTLLKIHKRIEDAGDYFKQKLFHSANGGGRFTEGLVTASLLFCIGSMTIMGSFEAGINHNYSIIFAKSAIDMVSAMMFAAVMGVGVAFSAIPVFIIQGTLTLLAKVISPYLSEAVILEMSSVGGTILIGIGVNMLDISPKKIRVADMIPAIFLPALYIPVYNLIANLF